MLEVQKIACANDAGFDLSFAAVCSNGRSYSSDTYPIDETRVIDLAATPFKLGTEFWLEVNAALGKTVSSTDHVVFAMNGQTATYDVRGTTQSYTVELID